MLGSVKLKFKEEVKTYVTGIKENLDKAITLFSLKENF